MKRISILALSIPLLFFVAVPTVFGAVGVPNGEPLPREDKPQKQLDLKDKLFQKSEEKQEQKEERTQTRCEKVLGRIDTRISNYEKNKNRHTNVYSNVGEKLTDISQKLEDKGYDVAQLTEDLGEFDALVTEYTAAYDEFIDLLGATKGHECGESEGAFKEALKSAGEQLKGVKIKRHHVRAFYAQTIREDIKDIRAQTPTESEDAAEGEEEEEDED